MSYVVQGFQGVTMVKRAPSYNAETKILTYTTEYQGSEAAVRGLELPLSQQGLSYRTDHNGPVWSLFVDDPVQESIDENLDRWEIFTESTEKSLFELSSVVEYSSAYDAGIGPGDPTFKSVIEAAVASKEATPFGPEGVPFSLVAHLRSGVTGWQLDFVGIRRTRRMLASTSQGFRVSLDDGLYIYNTGQLGVPSTVAFGLPITPPVIPPTGTTLFRWGWRKRSQRVEIIGSFVEQTVELLFAPWSTLAYRDAQNNLAWT